MRYSAVSTLKRARNQAKANGLRRSVSRWIGKGLFGSREHERNRQLLDQLFDVRDLRRWWVRSGIRPFKVPHLNHLYSRAALEKIQPDVIVRVSGGLLKRHIFSQARLATLNIHHGQAPLIRGLSNIAWGILENRREWIGTTIHVIDEGVDTGTVLWRGAPQLAPGDTAASLYYRAHLEGVAALVRILEEYARSEAPPLWELSRREPSNYRSAFDLAAWLKFLFLGRGRRARVLIERAIEC
jgi:methionyl-tRNA formyltransferase